MKSAAIAAIVDRLQNDQIMRGKIWFGRVPDTTPMPYASLEITAGSVEYASCHTMETGTLQVAVYATDPETAITWRDRACAWLDAFHDWEISSGIVAVYIRERMIEQDPDRDTDGALVWQALAQIEVQTVRARATIPTAT